MTVFEAKTFRAMGTDVELLAAPALPEGAADRIQSFFACMEARFSRFRPDSELSLLNLSAGRPFCASPTFVEVLRTAVAAARDTGGLFEPLVLPQLEAAGYREPIDSVRRSVQIQAPASAGPTYRDIEISADGTVIIPAASGVDLGGFVKGWTVDRAAELMAPGENWCINAGGDLLALGAGPDGEGWVIGVEDPFAPDRDVALLRINDRAVATSSTMRRRWATQAGMAHHLIDPRAGRSAQTDLVSVTVVAPGVAQGEVLAKQVLLLGSRDGRDCAARNHVAAILVDDSGSVATTEGAEDYVVV